MDWKKNRLMIGALVLAALAGAAVWAVRSRTGDTPLAVRSGGDFPDLARADIAALEVTRPGEGGETIRLALRDGTWHVTSPLEAVADQSTISTVLDKLDDLEVAGIASSNPEFHERLEVDPAHGIHVIARNAGGEALADLWIGAFRSGNTMVRVEGQDRVVSIHDSIKFAFDKDLRDWRDRSVLDVEADDVREVEWAGPSGSFRFTRTMQAAQAAPQVEGAEGAEAAPAAPTLGDWQVAEVSFTAETPDGGVPAAAPSTTIENFQPSRVQAMVRDLARMRASDFAAVDVTADGASLGDAAAHVTLTVGEGAAAVRHTVRLGAEANAERHDAYAMREGSPTIFVVSRFLGDRVAPSPASFQPAPTPPPSAVEAPDPGGMMMPPGGGGGELPPELMEQIRRQMEAQGLGGGGAGQ